MYIPILFTLKVLLLDVWLRWESWGPRLGVLSSFNVRVRGEVWEAYLPAPETGQ